MARSYIKANGKGYLGTNFAYSWYATLCDCKEITFSNYVTCLEKLDLIYVYKPQDHKKTNVLAHKKYEKYIIKWAIESDYGKKEDNQANKRRSLMGKYNYLVKQLDLGNPCPYTKKELKEGSKDEYVVKTETETLNSMIPIWKKKKSEVT